MNSAFYIGRVVHRRWKPKRHRLAYRVFSLLADLDELSELPQRLRWFSHNRFNLFGFYDRDHGDASDRPLRDQIADRLRQAGSVAG